MSVWDKNYLLENQYKTAAKLDARIALHMRFSTNKYGWRKWVFDHFKFPPRGKILELGCGPGYLWKDNHDRIPKDWQIILSDFSEGMIRAAKDNLAGLSHKFSFQVIDAEALPFGDEDFDGVVANHMLYHIPDLQKGLSEIWRMLKNGGMFYAATNGNDHMKELDEFIFSVNSNLEMAEDVTAPFRLENGQSLLSDLFSKVNLYRYDDSLAVTEVEPLVAYVRSTRARLDTEQEKKFRDILEQKLARERMIKITKAAGLFEAIK